MNIKQKKRVFLIGCPRSGTTLLQSILTAHSQINSFPESHFFRNIIPDNKSKRYWLGMISPRGKIRLQQFLKEMNREDLSSYLPRYGNFQGQYIHSFVKILDGITEEQQKSVWIEKTPDHLFYIEYINKSISGVKFIHIIRSGTDTIASLYEVTHKYPQIWGGKWSINQCVNTWVKSVGCSLHYVNSPNHFIVRYEDLVDNPSVISNRVCDFLDISLEKNMLEEYKQMSSKIVLKNEPWKKSISESISNKNGFKFAQLFDENEKQYIIDQVSQINLDCLNKL